MTNVDKKKNYNKKRVYDTMYNTVIHIRLCSRVSYIMFIKFKKKNAFRTSSTAVLLRSVSK
jgi:hypothetical protein